jgi:ATP-dependent helicase YprA (DUF1998 family)
MEAASKNKAPLKIPAACSHRLGRFSNATGLDYRGQRNTSRKKSDALLEDRVATVGLDIFALRDAIINEYEQFATSFTRIHATDIRSHVEEIYTSKRFWPEPLIQITPRYQTGPSIARLVEQGIIEPACQSIFPIHLYEHQYQALQFAVNGDSYVVTTGTGSGKSLCFFIPIVNAILTEKKQHPSPRTRAIIIYPMNALANSQLEELAKYLGENEATRPVSFARYTGQETPEERKHIADHPPDILLTNFMMLELLMTRQDPLDRQVIQNCESLRFLVLDELHTYRGRQGADVAMLVRRVRTRLSNNLQCIGTSATMKSDGTSQQRRNEVARVASRLFATQIRESRVIEESLERATNPNKYPAAILDQLGPAIDQGIPPNISDATLFEHPLAIWVEMVMGIQLSEAEKRLRRAPPLTLTD